MFPLAEATVNGDATRVRVEGPTIRTDEVAVDTAELQEFRWTDLEGLSARTPFQLRIRAVDDLPLLPTTWIERRPRWGSRLRGVPS